MTTPTSTLLPDTSAGAGPGVRVTKAVGPPLTAWLREWLGARP